MEKSHSQKTAVMSLTSILFGFVLLYLLSSFVLYHPKKDSSLRGESISVTLDSVQGRRQFVSNAKSPLSLWQAITEISLLYQLELRYILSDHQVAIVSIAQLPSAQQQGVWHIYVNNGFISGQEILQTTLLAGDRVVLRLE